jgi:c(7)-type cytochrome triheme protein
MKNKKNVWRLGWSSFIVLFLFLALYACVKAQKSTLPPAASEYEDPRQLPEPGPPFGRANRNPDIVLRDLPRDSKGAVDWVKSFKENKIKPHGSIDLEKPDIDPFDFNVEIKTIGEMPDVVFPHYPHTFWLFCNNCHPRIFIMKKGANPYSMISIAEGGESCGRCHGRVAFSLSNCSRCHVKPKE